jgi:hypothetical protein
MQIKLTLALAAMSGDSCDLPHLNYALNDELRVLQNAVLNEDWKRQMLIKTD